MRALIFQLDRQQFAIGLDSVGEILPAIPPAPIPQVPPIVEGVVVLRGRTIPVLDIRRRFGLPPKTVDLSDHLVIARAAGREVALRVDRALSLADLSTMPKSDIAEIVPGSRYVSGIAQSGDDIVFIHDLERFLSAAEAAALAEFEAEAAC